MLMNSVNTVADITKAYNRRMTAARIVCGLTPRQVQAMLPKYVNGDIVGM